MSVNAAISLVIPLWLNYLKGAAPKMGCNPKTIWSLSIVADAKYKQALRIQVG